MHSTIVTSGPQPYLIYIYCSSLCPSIGRYQQTVWPQRDQDGQPTKRLHHQSYCYQSRHCNQCAHHHLPKHGWHCHTRKFCNGLKHRTFSGCIIPFVFLYPRYANLYHTLLLKDYSSSGCVEIPTRSLPFFWYLLIVSLLVWQASLCKHGVFSSTWGFLSPQCSKWDTEVRHLVTTFFYHIMYLHCPIQHRQTKLTISRATWPAEIGPSHGASPCHMSGLMVRCFTMPYWWLMERLSPSNIGGLTH